MNGSREKMASGAVYYWLMRTAFVLLLVRADVYGVSYDDLIVLECDIKVQITFCIDSTTPNVV